MGFDFTEDVHCHDGGECIRMETDLERDDHRAFEWLAAVADGCPSETAEDMTRQMHMLRYGSRFEAMVYRVKST